MEFEEIIVNPWEAPAELVRYNPLSQVPVLVTEDGKAISDSCVILEYLDDEDGEIVLFPMDSSHWYALKCMRFGDGLIESCMRRHFEMLRPAEMRIPQIIEHSEAKISRVLAHAEEEFPNGHEFLLGKRFSVADISVGCALSYLDFRFNRDWRKDCPQLAEWYENISQRPSFLETELFEASSHG